MLSHCSYTSSRIESFSVIQCCWFSNFELGFSPYWNKQEFLRSLGTLGLFFSSPVKHLHNEYNLLTKPVLVNAGVGKFWLVKVHWFETVQACIELLEEENIQIPSWICFSSVDGENAPSGESFKECLDIINKSDRVGAVGINCAPPHFIEALIRKFTEVKTFRLQFILTI